jgi:hypothetical protein
MRTLLALLAALLVAAPARAELQQAELDQMLAPIALYPDPLLSQVLMAATYPLEVVEAARWSRAHPGLPGDEAVRAAAGEDWDPSVKSLLAFPQLLTRMDEQLDWTRQLGEAFLAQEREVMDAVQRLRRAAQAQGHLVPDERMRVADDGGAVAIDYANPRVVYVPYYDPWVVYGTWWWPAYPPVVWAPWPGYVVARSGFWWGAGIGLSVGFFYGGVSWPHHHVHVVHAHSHYLRPHPHAHGYRPAQVGKWQHDPAHRRGVGYRHPGVHKSIGFVHEPRRAAPAHDRPGRQAPQGQQMPPSPRFTAPTPRMTAPTPRMTATPPPRAVPYDRGHGRAGRAVDRPHDMGRVRADAAQHRAAQPHGFARHAGGNAGPVSVRPAVRSGMAGGGPRMAR